MKLNIDFFDDINNLMGALEENVTKDVKSFEDIINLDGSANREVYIGDICPGLGQTVEGYIRFWNKYDDTKGIPIEERKPIKIFIDSTGGSLTDTFTIIDAINMSKTPVWTIVIGCAYSGGFFSAIAGHKRFAYPLSSFMMHEGATSTGGDAHKFVNYSKFYTEELKQLKKHVLKTTKITEEEYEANRRDDWWFTSDEALDKGIIDEILTEFV